MAEEIKYLKDAVLGKIYTPSEWIGKPEYTSVTRLRMTCGGGMGGSSWYEYVHRVAGISSNAIVRFIRYDGKPIIINTAYIVEAEDFTLATVKLRLGEPDADEEEILTERFLIDCGKTLTLK